MAYVNANTSAKVGFRPYHLTDAFGAAHLSGMGEYRMNRPLDPWELYTDQRAAAGLHGVFLGQGHNPFKPEAWLLHGLGDDTAPAPPVAAPYTLPDAISVDPTMLIGGLAVLAVGMFLFGGNVTPKIRKKQAARLRQQRDALSKRISELEA